MIKPSRYKVLVFQDFVQPRSIWRDVKWFGDCGLRTSKVLQAIAGNHREKALLAVQ